MSQHLYPFVSGLAVMAVLVAAVSYTNPPLRCVNERSTAWLGSPVNKCYRLTDLVPEGALTPAR